ncbi:hypothetical protein [Nonomuraea ceibae]|uniref:hypothetical protein n=1 Tax=Nonomuraea ceibae TaxID=1935170 RepID=UPI001C5D9123|nr:hypothetical protein [Nonomuraea ceibae]
MSDRGSGSGPGNGPGSTSGKGLGSTSGGAPGRVSAWMRRRVVPVVLLVVAAFLAGGPGPVPAPGGAAIEAGVLAGVRARWGDGLDVVRGERSLVAGQDAPPGLLADLARRADTAGRRVGGVLGGDVRAVVLVPASAREAAALAGVASVDGLAAVADRGRVIVVPEHFARLTPVGRDVVLAHELTHVAAGTDGLPVWLYEGFADYVAYRDAGLPVEVAAAELAAEVRAGRTPSDLPDAADFVPGADAGRLARAYQEAWLVCRFVAARWGEKSLVRLYRDAQTYGAGRALASLGLSAGTLTRLWRAYVRDRLA